VDFNAEIDFLETILESNGIEDIDSFLHVNQSHTHDACLMKDCNKGLELLHDVVTREAPEIFVLVDSDTDGITSAGVFMSFVKKVCPLANVCFYAQTEKAHSIKQSHLEKTVGEDWDKLDLIVIPDAGSNDIAECKRIAKKVPILILDHHIIESEDIRKYATVLNCTDGVYPNPTLTGVGVVYKFLSQYCKAYKIEQSEVDEYLDLVALGMVADNADMSNLETRYYTLTGLDGSYLHNEFLKELIAKDADSFQFGNTFINFSWRLAPYFNAVTRYGSRQEFEDVVKAVIGESDDRLYEPRRRYKTDSKPEPYMESLQKRMARICYNCKSRQDNEVKRFVAKLQEKIDEEHLDTNSVLVVCADDIITTNTVTGLIANKLASAYKKPTILLRSFTDDVYGGSIRGYGKEEGHNFKSFLMSLGVCDSVLGHEVAAGIKIPKANVGRLIELCNEKIDTTNLVNVHEVDYEIQAEHLSKANITRVAEAYKVWCKNVPEPLFVITDLIVNTEEINGYSKDGSDYVGFIKFRYKGVDFIKKYCAKTDYAAITCNDRRTFGKNKGDVRLTVICSFQLAKYEDTVYPQAVIRYFESEPVGKAEKKQQKTEQAKATSTKVEEDEFIF
jgi:single-stranded-DNA-specific exonuclease